MSDPDCLTVHLLDTATGRPAAGPGLTLSRGDVVLASATTNPDGRCDAPLLRGPALAPGVYELSFAIAA